MKKKDKIAKSDKKVNKEKIVKKTKKEKVVKINKKNLKNDKIENTNDDLIIAKDQSEIKIDQKKENIELVKSKKSNDQEVNYRDESKHKTKRLFFGLGKEFWRISWPSNKKILNDFITTIIVMTFFTLIFYGIGFLIGTFIK